MNSGSCQDLRKEGDILRPVLKVWQKRKSCWLGPEMEYNSIQWVQWESLKKNEKLSDLKM